MQISITRKQINAIDFGIEQIREALEGATNDDYIQVANEAICELEAILKKCHLAREKTNDLNKAKKYIRSISGRMPPTMLDKRARLLIRKSKG